MDRAIDIATGDETVSGEALRQRFRYRCPRCQAFVAPCLGLKRVYFRHEQGVPWCDAMADEKGEGAGASRFARPLRKLVLDGDDWTVHETTLNVVSFSCELGGSKVERHLHQVNEMTETKASFFISPAFGGMQLGDQGHLYSNEPYFYLQGEKVPRKAEPPATPRELQLASTRHGTVKDGTSLCRLPPLDEWERDTDEWFRQVGLKPSLGSRYNWQIEEDLRGVVFTERDALSALLSSPSIGPHFASMYLGSPTTARWNVTCDSGEHEDSVSKGRIVQIKCAFEGWPRGEVYARFESDLPLAGEWVEKKWKVNGEKKSRSFKVRIGSDLIVDTEVSLYA